MHSPRIGPHAAPFLGWVVMGALPMLVSRDVYREQLRGMWMAQAVANWTGLRTELQFNNPPFPTDSSWGGTSPRGRIEFVFQDPWGADDDTDVEYVYLHLIDYHGNNLLTPGQIADGWMNHMEDEYLWESNQRALDLMRMGHFPPATSLPTLNQKDLLIDAQLTTEFFGAFTPGMPSEGLRLAALPIATTARGHAAHAAQFHVVLYALAPIVDRTLPPRQQVEWLVNEAMHYLPPESKARDIVQFVRADYAASTDYDNWEQTRDRIYTRYHAGASSNGFVYRGEFESSVNFATGIMALLYGGGNVPRTIQIGTLSGWDSDNPTATMGGLLGLLHGAAEVERQFGRTLSDRFNAARTRQNLPDYLPGDSAADDTFTLMADRMLAVVDRAVLEAGGRIDSGNYTIPEMPGDPPHPGISHNNRERSQGRGIGVLVSSNPSEGARIANGEETDVSGREVLSNPAGEWRSSNNPGGRAWMQVIYEQDVAIRRVRFIEGTRSGSGGWFESLDPIRVLTPQGWVVPSVEITPSESLDGGRSHQQVDFVFSGPVVARGIWLDGAAGGSAGYVTCLELDAFAD